MDIDYHDGGGTSSFGNYCVSCSTRHLYAEKTIHMQQEVQKNRSAGAGTWLIPIVNLDNCPSMQWTIYLYTVCVRQVLSLDIETLPTRYQIEYIIRRTVKNCEECTI